MKPLIEYITERFGKISEADDIANEIIIDIKNGTIKDKYEFIYNSITVYVHIKLMSINSIGAEYCQKYTKYKTNHIFIEVHYIEDNFDAKKTKPLLGHEILHGVEDLMFHYAITTELDISGSYISDYDSFNSLNSYAKSIYLYTYFLDCHERRAYMSQLYNNINKIIKCHNWTLKTFNYKVFIKELKQLNPWSIYFYFNTFIDLFKNDTRHLYIREFNKLHNTNYNINQAIKILEKQYNKFKKKFDELVPKIIFDILGNE